MSVIRYLESDPWCEFRNASMLFDQNLGIGARLGDFVQSTIDHMRSGYIRSWRHIAGKNSGTSEIQMDKDNFKVVMNIKQFAPNELSVKTVDDQLVIEGKHEEKQDEHGYVSRQFVRRYQLPKGVQADAVTSTLSSDGVLTVLAPRSPTLEEGNVRNIPITMTDVPDVKNTAENPAKKSKDKRNKK